MARVTATVGALLSCVSSVRMRRSQQASSYIAGVPVYGNDGPNENMIVFFGPEATDASVEAFCDEQGAHRCYEIGHPSRGGIPFVAMHAEEAGIESAVSAHSSEIEFLEREGELVDFDEVEEESESMLAPWGVRRVGAPLASATGSGVNIYVLDSGIRVTHQDFGGRAIPTYDGGVRRRARVCSSDDTACAVDDRGHGSHCAGSAGGSTYGVAPRATLRAMDRGSSYSDAYGAMDWLARNVIRPAVLTMSFGGGGQQAGSEVAMNTVVRAGLTVTVAAGNNNYDACQKTWAWIPAAITVGSTDKTDVRSSFSNYGSCVDIFAPGGRIVSAHYTSDTLSRTLSGTSMATPHVAGGAALILQMNPTYDYKRVKGALINNAERDAISDTQGTPNLLLKVA